MALELFTEFEQLSRGHDTISTSGYSLLGSWERYHYLIYLVLVPVLKDGKEKTNVSVEWMEWNEMTGYEKHIICETYCTPCLVELGGATSIRSS